jgi:hypothetical protein
MPLPQLQHNLSPAKTDLHELLQPGFGVGGNA